MIFVSGELPSAVMIVHSISESLEVTMCLTNLGSIRTGPARHAIHTCCADYISTSVAGYPYPLGTRANSNSCNNQRMLIKKGQDLFTQHLRSLS